MTRTNIDVDDHLVHEAMRRYHLSTKRQAVDLALRRLVGTTLSPALLEEVEGMGWTGDLDEMRASREPQ